MEDNNNVDLYETDSEESSKTLIIFDNLMIVLWIAVGTLSCWFFNAIMAWLYLGFAIIVIYIILRKIVCTGCYYYGKWCHIGWGKLSSLFFKKGNLEEFKKCVEGKLVPIVYMSLMLIPIVLLLIVTIFEYNHLKLVLILLFIGLSVYITFISKMHGCRQCKMRYLCSGSMKKK